MAFLGACNPYRIKNNASKIHENVGIKKNRKIINKQTNFLVHVVKPLPDTIIEYVWDFGTLTENDLKKYIYTMLSNKQVANT